MEISTTTSYATSEAKVTSHYWGYRELTADEVSAVAGGGDFSGDGFDSGGKNGCGSNENATGNQAAAATNAACAQSNAVLTVGIVQNMTRPGSALGQAGLNAALGWCDRSDGGSR
jgi:hypothetical protein